MNKRGPDCDDDCEGERGERGERGKRGPRGHDGHDGTMGPTGPAGTGTGSTGSTGPSGPTGPTGPTSPPSGSGGLLKFSGSAAFTVGAIIQSFLADVGTGIVLFQPSYPVAIARSLRNMSVRLEINSIVPSPNSSVTVELLRGFVPVFSITFVAGDPAIKSVVAGPEPYAIGETFDVRITTSGFVTGTSNINVSATVGID